eukprot:122775_1
MKREREKMGDCKKHFHRYSQMSHGLLTMKCLEHEQMIGYHIVKTPESTDEYFSALCQMYPGLTAPDDVILDNPCNVQPYMMYREPDKFKNTQFHSDIFHGWAGHICGPLYCSRYWKETSSRYYKVNTSSIESMNRILKRLSISSMWMNIDTFTRHLTLIMEIQNRMVIRRQEKLPVF